MNEPSNFFIGTAAWAIPKAAGEFFGSGSSHLERYSNALNGVEINTSFYRDHKAATYEKWARMTPPQFRFAVKLSRVFTHDEALVVDPLQLREVVEGIMKLGEKLAVLLIQLPPKLAFQEERVRTFFTHLRAIYNGPVVVEPRHKTWTNAEALQTFRDFNLGKVVADPEPCPSDEGFQESTSDICYFRWHGTPVIYESRYEDVAMQTLQKKVLDAQSKFRSVWVIFDNTTFGWATINALEMKKMLSPSFVPALDHSSPSA